MLCHFKVFSDVILFWVICKIVFNFLQLYFHLSISVGSLKIRKLSPIIIRVKNFIKIHAHALTHARSYKLPISLAKIQWLHRLNIHLWSVWHASPLTKTVLNNDICIHIVSKINKNRINHVYNFKLWIFSLDIIAQVKSQYSSSHSPKRLNLCWWMN